MSDEYLDVDVSPCPVCEENHTFEVEISLRPTLKMPRPGVCLSPQPIRLRETFTCPTKKEPFDFTFEIRLPAGTAVAGIEITG